MTGSILRSIESGVVIAAAVTVLGGLIVIGVERRERTVQRRIDALARYYAAIGGWTAFALAFVEKKRSLLDELNFRVVSNLLSGTLARRMWTLTDALLSAGAEVRSRGSRADLAVVNEVETALGSWGFGDPIPEAMEDGLRRLRERVEAERGRRWFPL